MTTLQLHFLDNLDKKHIINFFIYNSNLAKRWIELTKKNQAIPEKSISAKFSNVSPTQIASVRKRLIDCITRINEVYDEQLPLYSDVETLRTSELNYLHEQFELYGDRYEKLMAEKTYWTQELHENFLQLNELIHLHEDVNLSASQKFPSMSLLYDYYLQGLHEPILESDKIWLSNQFDWGQVYLGYNTLGKDWMKVMADNDLAVIEREQVRPQRRFAAETWINFGPYSGDYALTIFERWLNDLPESIRSKVPVDNLNTMTLGRFKIGQVIIDDYFLKYNSDRAQWKIFNSQAKLDWNINVFSTFVKLIDVRFYD
jgi:hypothetical protein